MRETWGYSGFKRIEYKAFPADGKHFRSVHNWKPSSNMPKWYSRIILEITKIRVERLRDIDCLGILKEGLRNQAGFNNPLAYKMTDYLELRSGFKSLWNSNHKKENTWQNTPWVWVIEFRRVK